MQLREKNNPSAIGKILDRPYVIQPSYALSSGADANRNLVCCVVHASGSGALRPLLFQRLPGVDIERVSSGGTTGDIVGSPGAVLTHDFLVTALHGEGSDRLRLISWDVKSSGAVRTKISAEEAFGPPRGTADVAFVGSRKLVVAVRDASGDLKVIRANIADSGSFQRLDGDAVGGIHAPPSIAYATPLNTSNGLPTKGAGGNAIVVTAVHAANHRLKLIAWETDGDDIGRRGDDGNNGVLMDGRAAIAGAPLHDLVVAAVQRTDPAGRLFLRSYKVGLDGSLDPRSSASLQGQTMTASPSIAFGLGPAGGGEVATAVSLANKSLRVDRWSVSSDGNIQHISGATETSIKCSGSPTITSATIGSEAGLPRGYYVAVRTEDNALSLSFWD